MGKILENITQAFKGHRNVVIIIAAAIMIEFISGAQYYYARNILEEELDHRAENELTVKAVLIKSMLNLMEKTVNEHLWDIDRNIAYPDSMYDATARIIQNTPEVVGCCLAFVPDYYASKGRFFEPYAYKEDGRIVIEDLTQNGDHDYTQHPAYIKVASEMKPFWSDPYLYKSKDAEMSLTTYTYPIRDKEGQLVAMCGLDLSLQQIGDTLNENHIYPSSFDLLLTVGGELISGPSSQHPKAHDIAQVVRLINDNVEMEKNSISGQSKFVKFKSESDGKRACVYFANIKGDPRWQVTVVCYDEEVYQDLYPMRFKVLLFMLLAFGILGFIIHLFARNERDLNRAQLEQERIGSELRIAQDIQTEMLPKVFPPYPERNDLQIFGSLLPAKEVGGDIYDFFLRDEKLFFCVGDVSGKGVPSAIIMAEIHSQFHMASMHEKNPAHIIQTLNVAACEGNVSNIFVTLFIGVLDLPTGRLRYCNAGHEVPYILSSANSQVVPLQVNANIPIGLFEDFQYKIQEFNLAPDTTIFLYTDGLTEAKNPAHEQFGIKRIEQQLVKNVTDSPEEIVQEMNRRVHIFADHAEQSDDLTMLAVKYTPRRDEYIATEEFTFENDVRRVRDLNTFVKSVTDKLHIDASQASKIKLAVEEAVVNVIEYAYPHGVKGDIAVQAKYNDRKLKFVIIDSGVAFDPTEAAKADTSLSVEERPIGGLGLLLVRELMDSINYERLNNKNILSLMIHYKAEQKI